VLKERVFNPGSRSYTGPMFAAGRFMLRNSEEMVVFDLLTPPSKAVVSGKSPGAGL
jgi:hypothetical protein